VTLGHSTRLIAVAFALAGALGLASQPSWAEPTQGWKSYIERDYQAAEKHWRTDVARGDPNGAFGLAILAERAGDAKGATEWYEKAALGGVPSAQVLTGQRYAEGVGVERNPVRAYAWFARAMAAGVPNAEKLRDRLAATMTPSQIKEAGALAETLAKP